MLIVWYLYKDGISEYGAHVLSETENKVSLYNCIDVFKLVLLNNLFYSTHAQRVLSYRLLWVPRLLESKVHQQTPWFCMAKGASSPTISM